MGAITSQITSLTIVYSTVYSDADQRKHQSSASLAFVGGIHRGPVNSPHKWPVTRKMFPFDDVIMWWQGDSRGQLISSHCMSLVLSENFSFNTRKVEDYANVSCKFGHYCPVATWWCHDLGAISALLPAIGDKGSVTWGFDVFFDVSLNQLWSTQSHVTPLLRHIQFFYTELCFLSRYPENYRQNICV